MIKIKNKGYRSLKHCVCESKQLFFEASNQEFLMFVIRFLSQNPDNWKDEWVYDGCYRKEDQCVCGKEGIRTVFIIRNTVTNVVLSPIGSVCIGKFNSDIIAQLKAKEFNFNLLDAIGRGNKYMEQNIAMTQSFISKKDVDRFYRARVITSDEKKDCLKALNKRSATVADFDRGTDILFDKIIPAVRASLDEAVKVTTAEPDNVYFDLETRSHFQRLFNIYNSERRSASELEEMFMDVLNISPRTNESLLKTKRRIYGEMRILDCYHHNFYEARLVEKLNKKYLVIEDHHGFDDETRVEDYVDVPSVVNIFNLVDDIESLDELLDDMDFDNDFEELNDPNISAEINSKDELKKIYNSLGR